jgi:hypothetical protein
MTATASGMRSHRKPVTWLTPYLIATWDKCQKTDWDGLIDRLVAHRYANIAQSEGTFISKEAASLIFATPKAVATKQEPIQWWN